MNRTLYDVLGVPSTASAADIRAAYLKLSRRLHPDLAQGSVDPSRIQEVNEAWTTLRDPQQRAQYDISLTSPAAADEPAAQPYVHQDEWGKPVTDTDQMVHPSDWNHVVEDPPPPPPPNWPPQPDPTPGWHQVPPPWPPQPPPGRYPPAPPTRARIPIRQIPTGRPPRNTLVLWGVFYGLILVLATLSAIFSPSSLVSNLVFYTAIAAGAAWAARARVRDLRLPKRYVGLLLMLTVFTVSITTAQPHGWGRTLTAVCGAAWLVTYLAGTEEFVRARRAQLRLSVPRLRAGSWALTATAITALLLLTSFNTWSS